MEWAAAGLVILFVGLMISRVEHKLGQLERRLHWNERQLTAIVEELGIAPLEEDFSQVDALLEQGKKIEAIRVYRKITGAGLAEAKEAVESRAAAPPTA